MEKHSESFVFFLSSKANILNLEAKGKRGLRRLLRGWHLKKALECQTEIRAWTFQVLLHAKGR